MPSHDISFCFFVIELWGRLGDSYWGGRMEREEGIQIKERGVKAAISKFALPVSNNMSRMWEDRRIGRRWKEWEDCLRKKTKTGGAASQGQMHMACCSNLEWIQSRWEEMDARTVHSPSHSVCHRKRLTGLQWVSKRATEPECCRANTAPWRVEPGELHLRARVRVCVGRA